MTTIYILCVCLLIVTGLFAYFYNIAKGLYFKYNNLVDNYNYLAVRYNNLADELTTIKQQKD